MHGSDRVPDLNGLRASRGWNSAIHARAKWRSSPSARSTCTLIRLLDTADIVREAIYRQLSEGIRFASQFSALGTVRILTVRRSRQFALLQAIGRCKLRLRRTTAAPLHICGHAAVAVVLSQCKRDFEAHTLGLTVHCPIRPRILHFLMVKEILRMSERS